MPIANTDIVYRLSGGGANSTPALSLGGAKSSTVASTDLFDDVNSTEAASGDTEYRCIYVHNNHGSLTMENTVVWIQSNTPSTATAVRIAAGTSAINGTEQGPLATEATAPSGVTWSTAANEGAAVSLGNIPSGQHKAVWIERVVTAGATAYSNDGFTLRVKCDTAA